MHDGAYVITGSANVVTGSANVITGSANVITGSAHHTTRLFVSRMQIEEGTVGALGQSHAWRYDLPTLSWPCERLVGVSRHSIQMASCREDPLCTGLCTGPPHPATGSDTHAYHCGFASLESVF